MAPRPVAVVTGTSRGIGRGIAEHLVERGFRVAGCSRGPATFEADDYAHAQLDVGDELKVRGWIRTVKGAYGRIDALISSAGHVESALLMTLTPSRALNLFIDTHVKGAYFVCREVAKIMVTQREGRIVTISSVAVPLHLEGASAYVATKGAIVEMTKVLAKELAPAGITCNTIAPGLVLTEQAQQLGESWAQWFLEQQTIKRPQTIEEVCHVVDFLLDSGSGAVTGQVITMGLVT